MATNNYFGNAFDAAREQIIGAGDAYVTLSGDTEEYSSVVDLEGYMGVEIAVEVDFDTTPTDDVTVRYYPCDDVTPTLSDTVGKPLVRMDSGTDPNVQTFSLPAGHRFVRVGVVQTGATDSHDVRAYARKYRVAGAEA